MSLRDCHGCETDIVEISPSLYVQLQEMAIG